jgi:hypothetical protein
MITEKIIFEESDGVATLILNRPDQGNAVDLKMIRAIEESFSELNENKRSLIKVRPKILASIGAHRQRLPCRLVANTTGNQFGTVFCGTTYFSAAAR